MATATELRLKYSKMIDNVYYWGSNVFLIPFIGRSKLKMFGFYVINLFVFCTLLQLLITLYNTQFSNFLDVINIAPNIGICFMTIVKYSKIHYNREVYSKIFEHYNGEFWNVLPEHSEENVKIISTYSNVLLKLKMLLHMVSIKLCIVANLFPWAIMVFEEKVLKIDGVLLYPFDAWYPFDKIRWYWIAYAWEGFMSILVILTYSVINLLNSSYIGFICVELKLLGCWLEGLISPKDVVNIKRGRKQDIYRRVDEKLKLIIKRFNVVCEMTSALDSIFGDIMLLSYGFGSVFICLTAFSATVTDDVYNALRYFSFFLSVLLDMCIQCMMGQLLTDHSQGLTNKIYFNNWVYASKETKKTLLLLIVRTQKPLTLTAKGYVIMNLNTFANICGSSYSYFNLLHTIYKEKNK